MSDASVQEHPTAPVNRVDVVVLDDDQDFIQFLSDVLEDEGIFAVRTFTDPREMFAAFESKLPGILLLDMKMGEHQGDAVMGEVQARWPGICIIVVTGYPTLDDMRAKFQQNVFDYLPKPFSIEQLRATLTRAIESYGLGRSRQDILRERLGPRIRILRTERNWSLKDFAAETELSVSQLSSIERGAHLPSIESFLSICDALDQKPSDIFVSIEF